MPKDHELREKFGPVGDELYQLLLTAYCYRAKVGALSDRLRLRQGNFFLRK